MPRASRYLLKGYTYHLTHRCHDRRFLLKFARDRKVYVDWLREGIRRYGVSVFGFCVTHNHVHLVVRVDDEEAVAALLRLAAGSTAQQYNMRKERTGSLWEHPYQCTVIEDGRHLFNCLQYVDLNMVRAGVVKHPAKWAWCGYRELMGCRKRYRLLAVERLLASVGVGSAEEFRKWYRESIEDRIARDDLKREAYWTQSLAIGSEAFVRNVQNLYGHRREFALSQGASGVWTVRETGNPYKAVLTQEIAF